MLACYQPVKANDNSFRPVRVLIGENVISILRKQGFTTSERAEVLRRAPVLEKFLLTTDLNYLISQGKGRTVLRFYDLMSDESVRIERLGSGLSVQIEKPNFIVSRVRMNGAVKGSLVASIQNLIPSNWVSSRFMDAFLLNHDLAKLARGAAFAFEVEKKSHEGQFVKYGEVLEASLDFGNGPLKRKFHRIPAGGVFLNPKDFLSEKPLYAPVSYLRISSEFQPARRHPVTRRVQAHLGIDFELPSGAAVMSSQKGIVLRSGRNRAAGNFIVVQHAKGFQTFYNHLQSIEPSLRRGSKVLPGQRLGRVGCTGYCTRPHLHFAVKSKGRMVDPARYLKAFPFDANGSLRKDVAAQ